MNKRRGLMGILALALCALGGACNSTAVNKDSKTTLLNADDMVTMTNQMAASIVADPRIQAAWAAGPLKIVVKPVTNFTSDIIPDADAELYVARLTALLSTKAQLGDRFVWCINRSDYDKLRAQEVPEAKLGMPEGRIVPEYALYAEFHSDTQVSRSARSDTYLCVYKLTRISGGADGAILWGGEYQTSKAIKKGFLD